MTDDEFEDDGDGEFNPDWTVAPAGTLAECFEERGWTLAEAAAKCGLPVATLYAVLRREPLTDEVAAKIAAGTGTSEQFWLNYERQYRSDLQRGRKDTSPPLKRAWLMRGGVVLNTTSITVGEGPVPNVTAHQIALAAAHRRGEHTWGSMRRDCPLCR